ncbi:MAG: hypothetical protein JXN59_01425 [Anaerolineae bacterium]|nr:hypothetical protein [Anaerolineae bacterium]
MEQKAASHPAPDLRRNISLIVLNGVAFGLVDTLIKPNLVLVVFLATLTDNPVILGMPMALWTGGFMLSQLAVTGHVQRATHAMPIYRLSSLVRMLLWLGLVAVTAFVTDPGWLIAALVFFLVGYPLTWGVAGLAFYEVVGKTTPPRLRGPVFSMRMVGSGILALLGGWYVNRVLAAEAFLSFPRNYALIFSTAAVVTVVGLLAFHAIREPESVSVTPQAGLRGRWQEIRAIWQGDRLFRHYVIARVALLLASGTSPLIIVYARLRFDLPLSAAGAFLIVDTITGLISVAVSGWISARLGNRTLIRLAAGMGALAFGLVSLAGMISLHPDHVFGYFLVVFVLLAVFTSASTVAFWALTLNIAPEDQRPLYVGLANTIFGSVSYLSIGQGALVILLGYQGLFMLATMFVLLSLWQIVVYVYDPTESGKHRYARA